MKISVCIAAYNGGRFIREQVMSILPQLGEDDEIIVSDDGSIDDTINILNSFHDKRIKIFINEGRHGVVPNFENALKHSSGDYIFFSDQDDTWNDNKVKKCVEALNDADLVVHNSRVVSDGGSIPDYDFFQTKHILWHDMWIGLITERHGITKFINDQLLYYRRHNNNASTTGETSSYSRWMQLKYRAQMFYYTMIR